MKDKIAFVTVLDDNYIKGFFTTVISLLECSPNFDYDIVILDWGGLNDENKKKIKQFYNKVIFKKIEKEIYDKCKYDSTYRTWHYNCNYRFDIFLMSEYDKIIFFDCDIIFQLSAEELLSYDVDFGACEAMENGVVQINKKIGFDAGLMIIGKKYINKNVFDSLINISLSKPPIDEKINFKSDFWVSDEPILNTYFLDKITWIPDKFNFLFSKMDFNKIKNKLNIQFTGHNKPWFEGGIEEKFSKFTIETISKNTNNQLKTTLIFKKALNLYKKQVDLLKNKNIYIDDIKVFNNPSYI
jgi:lipopolysaccharide biosynthesis glycosyltransferase